MDDCRICAKHRGEGPLVGPVVWADATVVVAHRPVEPDGQGVFGYLFVETRRHAETWDALTKPEVDAVADAAWRSARALRVELAAEFVFSAIIGTGVSHFHQHVVARHPGTPDHIGWMDSASWDGAPRGDAGQLDAVVARLRAHLL